IVKSHKGHITCYSELGTGTAFKIYLPAIVQEIEQDPALTQQIPAFGTETILVVDDEESIRKLGEEMLRMAGYKVLMATNGIEALEVYRFKQDRIALVLLDLMMPEMGGKQCLEELLKINPGVRVVVASGYSANGPTKEALGAGAKAFINKPYNMGQVLTVVRTVLDAE
ncbi:MAG: response regulator, partial [Pseudomonadota bacterium]